MFNWTLNAVAQFVTTTATLLIFLYLMKAEGDVAQASLADIRKSYRRLQIAIGLLALWLLLQDAAIVFL